MIKTSKIIKIGKNKICPASICIEETKNEMGEYHSENDIPSIKMTIFKTSNGVKIYEMVVEQSWHKNGVLHRENENGPAVDSLFKFKEWRQNGILTNRFGPALIYYHLSDWEHEHHFYVDGIPQNPFNKDGPIIIYNPHDSVCSTEVYKNDSVVFKWVSQELKEKYYIDYENDFATQLGRQINFRHEINEMKSCQV